MNDRQVYATDTEKMQGVHRSPGIVAIVEKKPDRKLELLIESCASK